MGAAGSSFIDWSGSLEGEVGKEEAVCAGCKKNEFKWQLFLRTALSNKKKPA